MSGAGLCQLAALALTAFGVLTAGAVAVAYPRLRARVHRMPAESRANLLTALAAAPVLGAAALVALCFLPSLLDGLWPGLDHCVQHGADHSHFCIAHLPSTAGSATGWAIAVGTAGALLAAMIPRLRRLLRSRRLVNQFLGTAGYDPDRRLWIASIEEPIALTTGLLRPRVLASQGLLAGLRPDLVTAVLAHEQAHAVRKDGLRRAFAALASIAHLPWTRRRLLGDLDLAIEQACDDQAARSVGDRLTVARALLAVRALGQTRPHASTFATLSVGGSSLDARVDALLGDPQAPPRWAGRRLWALLVVIALLLADPLHHLTETALGLVTR